MSRRPPTNLEHALLGLLQQHPQSGYDLRKIFATTAMGNYSSSPGAIYPALRRLEERGLIAGRVDDTVALRPKKIFRLTRTGRAALQRWLLQPIGRDDVMRKQDELLLRFAFYSCLDRAASRRFLSELAQGVEEYLEELKEQRHLFPDDVPVHGRMAFEFGLEQYRAWGRWARKALEHFKEDE